MLKDFYFFAISILIGLLIGLERERSHPQGFQAIGVRTFILFAILGTLAYKLDNAIFTLTLSLFVFAAILFGYLRTSRNLGDKTDIGLTTEISAAAVFGIGYMLPQYMVLSCVLAGIVLLTLLERQRLHQFARIKITSQEIEAITLMVILIMGVLPLLPNHTVDHWHIFNPQKFGILFVMVALIQFIGYFCIRLFGDRLGRALLGFIGGLMSSTAVFVNLKELIAQNHGNERATLASGILAIMAMLTLASIIIFTASQTFFAAMILPISAMLIIGGIFSSFLVLTSKPVLNDKSPLSRPLNFRSIIRLSLFLGVSIVLIGTANRFYGAHGILFVSFFGGLFEVHGIILSTALLFSAKQLNLHLASLSVMTALLASYISKLFLLWTLTPKKFALKSSILLILMMAAGYLGYLLI